MDIKTVFVGLSIDMSIEDCKLLVDMYDTSDDGEIDFSEFVRYMMAVF